MGLIPTVDIILCLSSRYKTSSSNGLTKKHTAMGLGDLLPSKLRELVTGVFCFRL